MEEGGSPNSTFIDGRGAEGPALVISYFFETFQNTGTGATKLPSTFLRMALG